MEIMHGGLNLVIKTDEDFRVNEVAIRKDAATTAKQEEAD